MHLNIKLPLKGKYHNLFPIPLDSIPLITEKINLKSPIVIFTENVEQSARIYSSWKFFYPNKEIIYFPDWEVLPYEKFSPNKNLISERITSLWKIINQQDFVLIIPITTALQKLPPKNYISQNTFFINLGDKIDIEILRKNLSDCGYISVDNVITKGEFAIRGCIIDLFPISSDKPFRIDLFGNEVESIKSFDCNTQITQYSLEKINILPAYEFATDSNSLRIFRKKYKEIINSNTNSIPYKNVSNSIFSGGIEYYFPLFFEEEVETIFNYIPDFTNILLVGNIADQSKKYNDDIALKFKFASSDLEYPPLEPKYLFLKQNEFFQFLKSYPVIKIGTDELLADNNFKLPEVAINHKSKNIVGNLAKFTHQFLGRILICAESLSRIEIIIEFMNKFGFKLTKVINWNDFLNSKDKICITLMEDLINGFILPFTKVAIITELDLYKNTSRSFTRNKKKVQSKYSINAVIKDLSEISIGDKVVHEDYGIGIYKGLIDIDLGDGLEEFMLLEYQDNAKLYVPISKIFLVTRYLGQENVTLNKLGKSNWSKIKQKAIYKSYDIAAQLLELYAKRELQNRQGYIFDKNVYSEFVDGFNYEETQDQINAINDVINDLSSDKPMDRLICGDVGFGKTEVVLRASFLVAISGKQVAVLVPTTLLVEQHLKIFIERFLNFPIKIKSLSRFSSNKENANVLQELEQGKVDIVIGTHKLIHSSVKFKNLGLLVIDEEHRFGVNQKEQLKKLRSNVDFLSLTATPIPRTLSMALDGIRDLSIIATAPEKRLSIKTFVYNFSDGIIKEAILRELKRNGQVFFLHNDVSTIESVYKDLCNLIPYANICIAHGQLPEEELANVMRDFLRNVYNVMICSTIIETGIDIPNANTIIINRADKFGIAQLHQLRGRVGRSAHQAYAYLLVPDYITTNARKRLDAIATSDELGSGFTLAMHDLEIRGSGEILGEEQSGQINQVGLTLYSNMLKKAVNDLKNNKSIDDINEENVTQIKLYEPALLPSSYCSDTRERLVLYKRLSLCKTNGEVNDIYLELIDRFGLLLDPVKVLLESHKLRIFAQDVGITNIDASNEKVIFTFARNNKINHTKVIKFIQKEFDNYKLLGNDRLVIKISVNNYKDKICKIYEIIKDIII